MNKKFFIKFRIIFILAAACLLTSTLIVYGWTGPSVAPPTGNVPRPLHIGPEGQEKAGGLWLNTGGATTGLIVEYGNVGIGTISPQYALDVDGFVRTKSLHQVSDEGLVLAMNFNSENVMGTAGSETVLDASGYNNHGTNYGATHLPTGGASGGGAFSFDGLDDYVNISSIWNNFPEDNSPFTLVAWFKPDSVVGGQREIIDISNNSGISGFRILHNWPQNGDLTGQLGNGTSRHTLTEDNIITTEWQFVVFSFDGTNDYLYYNGVLKKSGSGSWVTSTAAFIGKQSNNAQFFNGPIDDVRIYNRALSEDEITALYLQRSETQGSYVSQRDVFISPDGNVGIGTVAPAQKLHVVGEVQAEKFCIGDECLSAWPQGEVTGSGTTNYVPLWTTSSNIGNSVIYQSGSNIGIGTTSPGSTLDVAGNININEGSAYLYDGVQGLKLAKGTDTFYANTSIGDGAGNSTATRQTAVGYQAGDSIEAYWGEIGYYQAAVGYYAGNTNSGNYQTALGAEAGNANSGNDQTAVGYYAGRLNTGDRQTALGVYAGWVNTGDRQTAVGYDAGNSNIGNYQTAVGHRAGNLNTGNSQTVLGYGAGNYNSGHQVIGVGYEATMHNTANDVVAIGYQAGKDNAVANQFIIKQANINATPLIQGNFSSGNIGIGTTTPAQKLHVAGYARADSGFCIGTSCITAWPQGEVTGSGTANYIPRWTTSSNIGNSVIYQSGSNIGIGTTTPSQALEVNGNVKALSFLSASDASLKMSIGTLGDDVLSKVIQLRGISFRWKENGEPSIGFLADEVEKLFPEVVFTDQNGVQSIDYSKLVAPLAEAIQKQEEKVESQQKQIELLMAEIEELKGIIENH